MRCLVPNHPKKRCPARSSYKCHSCSKIGYWSKACKGSTVVKVSEVETSDYFLGEISGKHVKPWTAKVCVYDKRMEFNLDSGADVTVVPVNTYTSLGNKVKLVPSNKVLLGPCTYKMDCVGRFSAHLKVDKAEIHEDVCVIKGLEIPLLSRQAAEKLQLITRAPKARASELRSGKGSNLSVRGELTIVQGVLLKSSRVVIPSSM